MYSVIKQNPIFKSNGLFLTAPTARFSLYPNYKPSRAALPFLSPPSSHRRRHRLPHLSHNSDLALPPDLAAPQHSPAALATTSVRQQQFRHSCRWRFSRLIANYKLSLLLHLLLDYPLLTQDDLIHTFSTLKRDVNFLHHTSNLGWKKVEASDGALTNFEVLDLLRSRGAGKDASRAIATVSQSEFKVFDYLDGTVACNQTRETIDNFVEECQKFELAKAEILNIVNIRPRSEPELFPVEIQEIGAEMGQSNPDTPVDMNKIYLNVLGGGLDKKQRLFGTGSLASTLKTDISGESSTSAMSDIDKELYATRLGNVEEQLQAERERTSRLEEHVKVAMGIIKQLQGQSSTATSYPNPPSHVPYDHTCVLISVSTISRCLVLKYLLDM
ncbi:uncharacterized protein LOC131023361 [Salvia miltiorrhiza]|uniref:uncharacterized protein LOC131023361 n=1 Tax=Salvia miltiorrhiza TaxID=226208 RepID=UPI0025ABBA6C|nr:uncharacterized protein LOC131023361 [Salvia miltiorrhiza]